MKPDEFFGSVADDVKPLDLETTCTSPGCNNPRAHGYLMCWDCRDRLDLKTEGTRPPKREVPSVTPPREQHPWNAKDVHRLRMNAHLGAKRAAQVLKRTESSVRNMANLAKPKISLRQCDPQKNDYLQAQIALETAARPGKATVEVETTDTEKCEGCSATATQHDIEEGHTQAVLEAEDEHEKLEARAEHYRATPDREITERANRLLDQSTAGRSVSAAVMHIPTHIAMELIDIRLRLITSSIETTGSGVPASTRCLIEDNAERIRELVKDLAS